MDRYSGYLELLIKDYWIDVDYFVFQEEENDYKLWQ